MENEKESRVLEAAKSVFLRYGFRRVTMQDIAEEAGISRPALYLIYSNKEEVFLAAIRDVAARNLRTIREDLWVQPTVESSLQFAFEVWAVQPYQLMLDSPDARDLIDCAHGFAREVMEQATREFEVLLVEILKPLVKAPVTSQAGLSELEAAQIAHLLASCTHGFKEAASSTEELRTMISGLITLTIAALRAPALASAQG
jgi:AcrR family transcriptional regulator